MILVLFSLGVFNFGSQSPAPNVVLTDQLINSDPRFDAEFICTGVAIYADFHIINEDDFDGYVEVGIVRKVDSATEVTGLFFIEANGSIHDHLQVVSSYCDPDEDFLFEPEFEVQVISVIGR